MIYNINNSSAIKQFIFIFILLIYKYVTQIHFIENTDKTDENSINGKVNCFFPQKYVNIRI